MGITLTAIVSLGALVLAVRGIADALNWIWQRATRNHREEHR